MLIKRHFVLLPLLIATSFVWGAKPIQNIVDEPVSARLDGSSRSLEDVKQAIIAGCQQKNWKPALDGDAQIKCSITVRSKHYAEVIIPYTESSYSILYSDIRVLDYDEKKQRIHRNYNKWIILLSAAIQQHFLN